MAAKNKEYIIEIFKTNGSVVREYIGNNQRANIVKQIKKHKKGDSEDSFEFIGLWSRDYRYIFYEDTSSIKISRRQYGKAT